jgi:hypothetical protein
MKLHVGKMKRMNVKKRGKRKIPSETIEGKK